MLNFLRKLLGRPQSWHAPGRDYARAWKREPSAPLRKVAETPDPLTRWFDARREGPGVWKWRHYLPAYHRHLQAFVGKSPVVLEVGVFSGGSLEMWPAYFGTGTRVYGVDIAPACKAYERPGVEVLIGDQGSRAFWRDTLARTPAPDIVIDDGSHEAAHQRATLECVLPHLAPGGVYAVEDVHGRGHPFAAFVQGLADELNAGDGMASCGDDARKLTARPSAFQSCVHSVHLYPFLAIIEKHAAPLTELVAPRRGTKWEPFLG
jgi:SAM-dependent methyltransferase